MPVPRSSKVITFVETVVVSSISVRRTQVAFAAIYAALHFDIKKEEVEAAEVRVCALATGVNKKNNIYNGNFIFITIFTP
jgi:hypothetical protein